MNTTDAVAELEKIVEIGSSPRWMNSDEDMDWFNSHPVVKAVLDAMKHNIGPNGFTLTLAKWLRGDEAEV